MTKQRTKTEARILAAIERTGYWSHSYTSGRRRNGNKVVTHGTRELRAAMKLRDAGLVTYESRTFRTGLSMEIAITCKPA